MGKRTLFIMMAISLLLVVTVLAFTAPPPVLVILPALAAVALVGIMVPRLRIHLARGHTIILAALVVATLTISTVFTGWHKFAVFAVFAGIALYTIYAVYNFMIARRASPGSAYVIEREQATATNRPWRPGHAPILTANILPTSA